MDRILPGPSQPPKECGAFTCKTAARRPQAYSAAPAEGAARVVVVPPPAPARTGLSSQRRSAALRDNGCASAFGCRGMLLPCRGLRTARGQGRGRLPAEGQRWVGREERPERVNVPSTAHAGSRRHRTGKDTAS